MRRRNLLVATLAASLILNVCLLLAILVGVHEADFGGPQGSRSERGGPGLDQKGEQAERVSEARDPDPGPRGESASAKGRSEPSAAFASRIQGAAKNLFKQGRWAFAEGLAREWASDLDAQGQWARIGAVLELLRNTPDPETTKLLRSIVAEAYEVVQAPPRAIAESLLAALASENDEGVIWALGVLLRPGHRFRVPGWSGAIVRGIRSSRTTTRALVYVELLSRPDVHLLSAKSFRALCAHALSCQEAVVRKATLELLAAKGTPPLSNEGLFRLWEDAPSPDLREEISALLASATTAQPRLPRKSPGSTVRRKEVDRRCRNFLVLYQATRNPSTRAGLLARSSANFGLWQPGNASDAAFLHALARVEHVQELHERILALVETEREKGPPAER
jgi:hypothetical protein